MKNATTFYDLCHRILIGNEYKIIQLAERKHGHRMTVTARKVNFDWRAQKMGMTRVDTSKAGSNRFFSFSIFAPHIWKIMIAAAYPFLVLATRYFETLERTGATGAFIADTLMPATMICYVALIFVLRKRAI